MVNTLYSKLSSCQGAITGDSGIIKQGYADLFTGIISCYDWDWYATLTFRNPCGRWKAERAWRDFTRYLRHEAGHRVEWFRIVEYQRHRDPVVPHIHAVMLNCSELRRLDAKDYWERYGFARVLPYNEESAGILSNYLAKDFAKDFSRDGELAYFEKSRSLGKYNRTEILERYPALRVIA